MQYPTSPPPVSITQWLRKKPQKSSTPALCDKANAARTRGCAPGSGRWVDLLAGDSVLLSVIRAIQMAGGRSHQASGWSPGPEKLLPKRPFVLLRHRALPASVPKDIRWRRCEVHSARRSNRVPESGRWCSSQPLRVHAAPVQRTSSRSVRPVPGRPRLPDLLSGAGSKPGRSQIIIAPG
jgi:hypothetical protein